MSPRLEGKDLVYDVKVLDGKQKVSGGIASLFIDTIGRPLTPVYPDAKATVILS